MGDARGTNLREPSAAALATATRDGRPSARIVLLKNADERGLVFFTNYQSRKGRELTENPRAALLLFWDPLARQVRVEGPVEKIGAEESSAYFSTRPRLSRIGAWASPQSSVIASREFLEAEVTKFNSRFPGDDIPIPPFWGGYRLIPEQFEFWHGRENRLHDRIRYIRTPSGWLVERLAP